MQLDLKRGILSIAIVIVLIIALYITFSPDDCFGYECFQEKMISCKPATYVNEEPEASWGYEILSKKNNLCEVEVTLLNAKEGDLDLRQYEGNSMTCSYNLGISAYPEKDLSVCHGLLKENLQNVIIDKLYRYVIDNIGEISESLAEV